MHILAIIGVVLLGYLYFTGKLLRHHLLPLALAALALFFFARGVFPMGAIAGAAAGYLGRKFLFSLLNPKRNLENQNVQTAVPDDVVQARALLGVQADDDEQIIKRKYRKLLEQHHPDRGGDEDYARAINIAKDVLLKYNLNNKGI